jgi:hypothetical protein
MAAVTGARLPLTVTMLRTGSGSKPPPSTVNDPLGSTTVAPVPPTVGPAGASTTNGTPDVALSRVTSSVPLAAPAGTRTVTRFGVTALGAAGVPANDTDSAAGELPKPVPWMSTLAPTGARTGVTATACRVSAAQRRTSVTLPLPSYTYSAPAPDASNTPVSRPAASRAYETGPAVGPDGAAPAAAGAATAGGEPLAARPGAAGRPAAATSATDNTTSFLGVDMARP